MREYVIVTDSTTDLPHQYAEENQLFVLALKFQFEGVEYTDYLDGREMPIKEFYQRLRSGQIAKTSQINVDEVVTLFSKIVSEGKDILYVGFSSALSGSFNSARIGKEIVLEQYPDANIILVDSKSASLGEGLLVHYAVQAKKQGMTLKQIEQYLLALLPQVCHWITVGNIETLRRGGRISGTAAFMAKTLSIKPIIHVDSEGRLIPRSKKIGRKKSLLELLSQMGITLIPEKNEIVFISHGDCEEDAFFLKEQIEKQFGIKHFLIHTMGPVVGGHTGPDAIAIFFIGTHR